MPPLPEFRTERSFFSFSFKTWRSPAALGLSGLAPPRLFLFFSYECSLAFASVLARDKAFARFARSARFARFRFIARALALHRSVAHSYPKKSAKF